MSSDPPPPPNYQSGGLLRYDTYKHGVGQRFQRLDTLAGQSGQPMLTVPFHPHTGFESPGQVQSGTGLLSACCKPERVGESNRAFSQFNNRQQPWVWTKEGKLRLSCEQPVVPVPILQEIHRRDRIIEVPQVEILDAIQPRIYNQDVKHQVPEMEIKIEEKHVDIPSLRYVDKEVIVPLVTGYTHKFVPKWEVREVPRPVVKYEGEQKIIEVEVPQVRFVDKIVEKEVIVDIVEKRVPKIIEIENPVETVRYVWKPIEKIVEIETIKPKFDVSLECPAPLIVPYTIKKIKDIPSVMVRKSPGHMIQQGLDNYPLEVLDVPRGTMRVPLEYIDHYSKLSREQIKTSNGCSIFNSPAFWCGNLPGGPSNCCIEVKDEEEVITEYISSSYIPVEGDNQSLEIKPGEIPDTVNIEN